MSQHLIQQQQQKAVQQQRLTAYQMLQVKLLEMPLAQLEEAVTAELDDNPALETSTDEHDDGLIAQSEDAPADGEETFEEQTEREERADALDTVLDSIDSDDRLPDYEREYNRNYAAADYEEIVYGDTVSFYDYLKEQMGEVSLNQQQHDILEYLIGSLDDDGLLRKDLQTIADELAIYQNIDVEEADIAEMLEVLQSFDPAGIGARSLQECLLIQVNRKIKQLSNNPDRKSIIALHAIQRILKKYFNAFKKKQWERIAESLHVDMDTMAMIVSEIKRLNPRPGAALGETIGRSLQQITPDFIVDTADDGSLTISLNQGNLPPLTISPSFSDMVKEYQQQRQKLSSSEREAYKYARDKVDRAEGFIEAVRLRQINMMKTMKAITEIQHRFFVDGDDNDIIPMVLKDVAERSGLDISTVSRVSNLKFVQTRWGIYSLRSFYNEGFISADGEELSTRKLKVILKEIISEEDPQNPLSDDALKKELSERGYNIARRTVAKYREQLGLPVARLRKSIN